MALRMAFVLLMFVWSFDAHAQQTCRECLYNNRCQSCTLPGCSTNSPAWQNYGSFCVSCESWKVCGITAKTDNSGDAADRCVETDLRDGALFLALDPMDPGLDTLAEVSLPAAHILAAAVILPEGVVAPIGWSSGVAPFSALPTRGAFEQIRSGMRPSESELQGDPRNLKATYTTYLDGPYAIVTIDLTHAAGPEALKKLGAHSVRVTLEPTAELTSLDSDTRKDVRVYRIVDIADESQPSLRDEVGSK